MPSFFLFFETMYTNKYKQSTDYDYEKRLIFKRYEETKENEYYKQIKANGKMKRKRKQKQ